MTSNAQAKARFGSWENWSQQEVTYLLRELCEGHYELDGDTPMRGFIVAVSGIQMALISNRGFSPKNIDRLVRQIYWMTDYLRFIGNDFGKDKRTEGTIQAIYALTKWAA